MSPSVEDLEDLPLKRRRPLLPSIPPAAVARSASAWQFSPGDSEDQSGFSKPPDPSAFRAPSAQAVPQNATVPNAHVNSSAGKAMAPGVRMPPPGADLTPNPYLPSSPAMTQGLEPQGGPQGTPAPSAPPSSAPGPQRPQGAPSVQDAISKRTATLESRLEQGAPQPGQHWYQKLGLALLSMTKLAPMAQQIVHPMWSQQMAQWQGANAADIAGIKSLETAASGESLEEQRRAIAEQRHAQAQDYSAREAQRQRDTIEHETVAREKNWSDAFKIMAKGREGDVAYLPENSPQLAGLQGRGYQVVPYAVYQPPAGQPGMVAAIPPAMVPVTADMAPMHPGAKPGDLIPWSEHRAALADYAKMQQEIAKEQAIAQYNPRTPQHVDAEQQFIDEYRSTHQGASIAEAQHAFSVNRQPPPQPERPPQALMIGPDGRAIAVRPGTQVPQGAQTPAGVNTASTPTSQSRSMAEMAGTVIEQVPGLLSQIDALKSKLGPAVGRWNDLWVNRAGMNDPDFAGLDQDLDLFASALVRTHFGARGGQGYREALKKNLGAAQSPEDLKARIQHAEKWLEGYAKMGSRGTQGPPAGGPSPVENWVRDPRTGKLVKQ